MSSSLLCLLPFCFRQRCEQCGNKSEDLCAPFAPQQQPNVSRVRASHCGVALVEQYTTIISDELCERSAIRSGSLIAIHFYIRI